MKKQKGRMAREGGSSLVLGVLILSVSGILVKICGFLYKVPLNSLLGDEMANVNAAYAVYTVLYTLSTAGIPSGIAVLMAEARARGDAGRGIFRSALSLLLPVGVGGTVLLFALAGPISHFNSGGDTYYCLLAIAPALFFVCVTSVYRGSFQGEGRMIPIAVSEVIEALGKVGLGLLFAFLAQNVMGLSAKASAAFSVLGITVGLALGAGYLAIVGRRRAGDAKQDAGGVRRQLLSLSLPIMLASLMLNFASLADSQLMRPLLASFYGDPAAAKAVYSDYSTGALTLFNLPSVLIYPITCAMIPALSGKLARKDIEGGRRSVATAFRTAALLSLPCAAIFAVLGAPILSLVFASDADMAANAGLLLSLLAPSVFLSAMLTVSNAVLQACRLQTKPIFSVLFGLCVKIAASLLLVPMIGPAGAPIGTVLFYVAVVVGNLRALGKHTSFLPRFTTTVLRPAGAASLAALAAWGTYAVLFRGLGVPALFPALTVGVLIWLGAVLLFGCVSEEDLGMLPLGKHLARLFARKLHHTLKETGGS